MQINVALCVSESKFVVDFEYFSSKPLAACHVVVAAKSVSLI